MEEENTKLFKKGENDFDFVQDDDDEDPILREATNKLENITASKKIDARFKLGCRMLLVGAVRKLIIFFHQNFMKNLQKNFFSILFFQTNSGKTSFIILLLSHITDFFSQKIDIGKKHALKNI